MLDIPVFCDEIKIKQLIGNLLSNSLKFTDKEIEIGFNAKIKKIKNNTILNIEISDTGLGMKSDVQKHVFLLL